LNVYDTIEVDIIIDSFFIGRELNGREIKLLAQGHTLVSADTSI